MTTALTINSPSVQALCLLDEDGAPAASSVLTRTSASNTAPRSYHLDMPARLKGRVGGAVGLLTSTLADVLWGTVPNQSLDSTIAACTERVQQSLPLGIRLSVSQAHPQGGFYYPLELDVMIRGSYCHDIRLVVDCQRRWITVVPSWVEWPI